jgi:hypothetical protein
VARKTVLNKTKRVREIARERVGPPKPTRPLEERGRKAKPKYPDNWLKEHDQ